MVVWEGLCPVRAEPVEIVQGQDSWALGSGGEFGLDPEGVRNRWKVLCREGHELTVVWKDH